MSPGLNALSCITAKSIQATWGRPKSRRSSPFNALLFLYREIIDIELGPIASVRAKKPTRLPTVLTRAECMKIIDAMTDPQKLMAQLLFGGGLRAMECLRLRVKDVDFAMNQIIVRDGKGQKDRVTIDTAKIAEFPSTWITTGEAKEALSDAGFISGLHPLLPQHLRQMLHLHPSASLFHTSPQLHHAPRAFGDDHLGAGLFEIIQLPGQDFR